MDKKGIYDICLALIPTECREWILCVETYGFLGSMSHQLNQMCQNNKTKQKCEEGAKHPEADVVTVISNAVSISLGKPYILFSWTIFLAKKYICFNVC